VKSSFKIEEQLGEGAGKYLYLIDSDRETVDKKDPYDQALINYQNRLDTIVEQITRRFRPSPGIKIGEFGCAQGIIALTLAEIGYHVHAFDINVSFIEYAQLKYEKGQVEWHVGNINELDFPKDSLDVAILGEVIEHCAFPEEIVSKVLEFVKPDGILIITTPNAARIRTSLPHFSKYLPKESRQELEKWQYGPGSSNHLFLFSKDEIKLIIPRNYRIISQGYLGGTILINRHNLFLLKIFPATRIPLILKFFSNLGIISNLTCHNLYAVIQKES